MPPRWKGSVNCVSMLKQECTECWNRQVRRPTFYNCSYSIRVFSPFFLSHSRLMADSQNAIILMRNDHGSRSVLVSVPSAIRLLFYPPACSNISRNRSGHSCDTSVPYPPDSRPSIICRSSVWRCHLDGRSDRGRKYKWRLQGDAENVLLGSGHSVSHCHKGRPHPSLGRVFRE